MKIKKQFILGLALGMAITVGVEAYGANGINTVTSFLRNNFTISYNGMVKDKGNYDLLVYNDRSYMPVRYLSEMLGCNVEWDSVGQRINITKPEIGQSNKVSSKIDEKNSKDGEVVNPKEEVNKDIKNKVPDAVLYRKLPQTEEAKKYRLSALYMSDNDSDAQQFGRKIFLRLTNLTDSGTMRIYQEDTLYEINGKKYTFKEIDNARVDDQLYNAMAEGKSDSGEVTIGGFIRIPKFVKAKDLVKVTVFVGIDGEGKIPVEFRIDMSKIK